MSVTDLGPVEGRLTLGLLLAVAGAWLFYVNWGQTQLARRLLDDVEPDLGSVRFEETTGPRGDGVQLIAQIQLHAVGSESGRHASSPWSAVVTPLMGTLEKPLSRERRARIYLHPDEAVPLMLAVKEGLWIVSRESG